MIGRRFCRKIFSIISILVVLGAGAVPAFAGECMGLGDLPLELKSRAAPGLISLVLDNTRAMYWTIMTSEGDGAFSVGGTAYQLLFPDHTYAGTNTLPYEYRNYWKTQWSGYNTMYYNPDVTYLPWARWDKLGIAASPPADGNADPRYPRLHPLETDTVDMNEIFYTISPTASSDTAIRINDYAPQTLPTGVTGEFKTLTGTWQPYNAGLNCYNNDEHYTNQVGATASWTVTGLDKSKKYDVYVYIPYRTVPIDPPDQGTAEYTVAAKTTVTQNYYQPDYNGWTLLAANMGINNSLTLAVTVKVIGGGYVDIDAIKIVPAGDALVDDTTPPAAAGTVNINFSHYFVQNTNGTFLVNMDPTTSSLTYYSFTDSDNDERVDLGELTLLSADQAHTAGIDTGRTYAQERQNFANWYQFSRKRAYTGVGALGQFIQGLSNVYFRLNGFPPAGFKYGLEPIRVTVDGQNFDQTDTVLANLYEVRSPQAVSNSSLEKALENWGELLQDGQTGGEQTSYTSSAFYTSSATYPYFTKDYGGECQQAFTILMTGGYWTIKSGSVSPGDVDLDGHSDTLADVAMYYYKTDLRTTMANNLPSNYIDTANWQHMVTYGISFGVEGSLDPDDYPKCGLGGLCPGGTGAEDSWPEPVSETQTTIDDLWHATVNGHGLFINAADPEKLVAALMSIRNDIQIRLGSASAVSTNSVQRQVGTRLYQGTYHSGRWSGDLLAKPIDVNTGAVQNAVWSAQARLELKNWAERAIFTFDTDLEVGNEFKYSSLTAAQKSLLSADDAMVQKMIDYLRGDQALEVQMKNGGTFRDRDCKLGDITHSEPVYKDGVIYVGANDGMLHAFDDSNGDEIFAYIPSFVFNNLKLLTDTAYPHRYYVDCTPYAATISSGESLKALLVGGLGKGGKGIYCLDITNAKDMPKTSWDSTKANVEWEYPDANDDDLGYTYSRPFIVNTKAEDAGWVVIFGNGYNSVSEEAVLYVLDAESGDLLRKFHTKVSGCNGIVGNATIIDPDFDGYADLVYAGDLKGNLWKFDVSGDLVADWKFAYGSEADPKPMFTAKNGNGDPQPITTAPDVMEHSESGRAGYIVIFGTGKYVHESDFDTTNTQTLYGIWDWQNQWKLVMKDDASFNPNITYLGEFTTDRKLSNMATLSDTISLPDGSTLNSELTLCEQKSIISGNYLFMSNNPVGYWDPLTASGSHVGWFFDLPQSGERVIRDPMIRNGAVIAIGTIPSQTPCSAGGISVLYQISASSGGAMPKPQFDTNGDNKVDASDVVPVSDADRASAHEIGIFPDGEDWAPSGEIKDKMIYKPVDIGDTLYSSDDSANIDETKTSKAPEGMMYWYEVDFGNCE